MKHITHDSDRAVSPVIGVVLMVAITVILAAVIGAFVLGLGDELGEGSTPSAQLSLSESDGNVQISHNGGDELDFTEFTIIVNGETTQDLNATELSPGESVVEVVNVDGETEIALRHDPSSSVLASGTLDLTDGSAAT